LKVGELEALGFIPFIASENLALMINIDAETTNPIF
jgi:hypothetical protein